MDCEDGAPGSDRVGRLIGASLGTHGQYAPAFLRVASGDVDPATAIRDVRS
jgi:hypothetical protein